MKKYFSKTLQFHQKNLLFQAHSHHCWPNAAFEGMQFYQELVQQKLDDKWIDIFSSIIPKAQKVVANLLGWPHASYITFGTNTHELLIRLLSSFQKNAPLNVLTTNYEYHSARRLFQSMKKSEQIILDYVEGKPQNIIEKLNHQLHERVFDVCFLSQAFFQTGYTLDEKHILELAKKYPHTFFIIDTYHSLAARKLNFATERSNIALLGGGYKYAMSGEGCCFLALHPQAPLQEPTYNGWMAEFSSLSHQTPHLKDLPSATKGYYKFMGATFDPIGLFRLCHVWDIFDQAKITPHLIKSHVKKLQDDFLHSLDQDFQTAMELFAPNEQGNFLSLKFKSVEFAEAFVKTLKERCIFTDSRDTFVRFGFGIYQDKEDVWELVCQLNALKASVQSKLELPV